MQLDDVFGRNARGLVQVVDILSHHAGRFARRDRAKRAPVAPARLRAAELFLHGEAPPPGLVARLLAGDEVREVDRPHPGPDAAGGTEIRDAAFGRDAGAGERHDDGVTSARRRRWRSSHRARSCSPRPAVPASCRRTAGLAALTVAPHFPHGLDPGRGLLMVMDFFSIASRISRRSPRVRLLGHRPFCRPPAPCPGRFLLPCPNRPADCSRRGT